LFFLFRDQTSKKEILNQRHNSSFFANLWKREMSHMQEFLLDIHGEMVEVLEDHSIRNHCIESLQARIEKQAAFISQQQIQINLQASEIEELRRKNHALELENQSLNQQLKIHTTQISTILSENQNLHDQLKTQQTSIDLLKFLIDNIQKILWEDLLPYRELRKPLAYLLFQHLPPNSIQNISGLSVSYISRMGRKINKARKFEGVKTSTISYHSERLVAHPKFSEH